ncbi:bifunctional 2',3'-cyclic-nucleotide 2'-phosphodiesterase/3'-nucleotidase [Rhodobacteraceae bacterium D3-12]|nr:bifunctional 2',3'-cyclic-nucleotide 2'-phosphodiesterase/3'-nucleotidase [Rhodobacteraceae bacterium D3-12]
MEKAQPQLTLRILQTSDLHGALRGHDYLSDSPSEVIGLTRTATLIREARAGARNTLLFDTGDFLQGSPICDFAAENDAAPDALHPMVTAMNTLNYDAVTLGNHDFNHGADFLFDALEHARFPVTSANFDIAGPATRPGFIPHLLLKRRFYDDTGTPVRFWIGVTGALPPQTLDWDHHLADDFRTADMVTSIRTQAAKLRAAGANLIVALAHTGIDPDAPAQNAENALIDIAAIDDVDFVFGGHTHTVFPSADAPSHPAIDATRGTIHGTPVVMPGFWGNHLGQLDLTLTGTANHNWTITSATPNVLPLTRRDCQGKITATTPEDPALLAITEPDHTAVLDYIRTPIGETTTPLHSFFSLLGHDSGLDLVATAQTNALAAAVAGTDLADLAILSSAAPLKTGRRSGPDHYTHIPPGPLTRRSLADLYYYPNTLVALRITGAGLRDWLEHSASLFSTLTPGTAHDTPLLDDHFPGYKFEVIHGLRYQIDPSQPPRFDARNTRINPTSRRITQLLGNDAPVKDDQTFLLATNTYRAHGIGLDMFLPEARPVIAFDTRQPNRDILRQHIQNHSPLSHTPQPTWSFAPLSGTTALFETSPNARAHLSDPALPRLSDLGDTPQGFARLRITL